MFPRKEKGLAVPTLAMAMLMAASLLAGADTVHLSNGKTVSGKVLESSGDRVLVEVQHGGIKAKVAFDRADVVSIEWENDPRDEFERKLSEVERVQAPQERAEQYLALGRWAVEQELIDEACEVYGRASRINPELAETAELEAARARLKEGSYAACARLLRSLLQRNPNHEQAKAMTRELERAMEETIEAELTEIEDRYRRGHFRSALVRLENLTQQYDRETLDGISQMCKARTGASLTDLMIDCRFRQGCPNEKCEGGIVDCSMCKNGMRVRHNRPVVGPPGDLATGTGGGAYGGKERLENCPRTYELCRTCAGLGYDFCKKCGGLGVYFGRVTEYEREEMVRTLVEQVKRLTEQLTPTAEEVTETVQEGNRTTTVKKYRPDNQTLNAYKTLPSLLLARRYLDEVSKLAPPLSSPAGEDLHGDLAYVEDMITPILSRKVEAYMTAAFTSLRGAMNYMVEGGQGQFPTDEVRKGVLEASRARHVTDAILDMDPTSRGILSEDMDYRQQLIDEFIQIGMDLMELAGSRLGLKKLHYRAMALLNRLHSLERQLLGVNANGKLEYGSSEGEGEGEGSGDESGGEGNFKFDWPGSGSG